MARRQRRPRRQDSFGKRARKDGYPARSVYKLEEIDRRVQLFRRGMNVLDLGASPGSWTLYAAKKVGVEGRVIGIDIKPHESELPPNAEVWERDIYTVDFHELNGPFDSVISDMAPNTTGNRDLDQARSFQLFDRAVDFAEELLKPGGTFVGKLFQGPDFEEARGRVRKLFGKVRLIRPEATRKESYEIFVIGLNRKVKDEHQAEVKEENNEV